MAGNGSIQVVHKTALARPEPIGISTPAPKGRTFNFTAGGQIEAGSAEEAAKILGEHLTRIAKGEEVDLGPHIHIVISPSDMHSEAGRPTPEAHEALIRAGNAATQAKKVELGIPDGSKHTAEAIEKAQK